MEACIVIHELTHDLSTPSMGGLLDAGCLGWGGMCRRISLS